MTRVWFFGCWRDVGHHLWAPDGKRISGQSAAAFLGFEWWTIDGCFVPGKPGEWSHGFTDGSRLMYGWTYLSAQDNTVDRRGGSHATFLAEGHHELAAMRALVIEAFPAVSKRLGLEHVEAEIDGHG